MFITEKFSKEKIIEMMSDGVVISSACEIEIPKDDVTAHYEDFYSKEIKQWAIYNGRTPYTALFNFIAARTNTPEDAQPICTEERLVAVIGHIGYGKKSQNACINVLRKITAPNEMAH